MVYGMVMVVVVVVEEVVVVVVFVVVVSGGVFVRMFGVQRRDLLYVAISSEKTRSWQTESKGWKKEQRND